MIKLLELKAELLRRVCSCQLECLNELLDASLMEELLQMKGVFVLTSHFLNFAFKLFMSRDVFWPKTSRCLKQKSNKIFYKKIYRKSRNI